MWVVYRFGTSSSTSQHISSCISSASHGTPSIWLWFWRLKWIITLLFLHCWIVTLEMKTLNSFYKSNILIRYCHLSSYPWDTLSLQQCSIDTSKWSNTPQQFRKCVERLLVTNLDYDTFKTRTGHGRTLRRLFLIIFTTITIPTFSRILVYIHFTFYL